MDLFACAEWKHLFPVVDNSGLWLDMPPLPLVLYIQMLGYRFCFYQRDRSGLIDRVLRRLVSDSTLEKGLFLFITLPWYLLVHPLPASLYSQHSSFPDPALILRWERYSSAWERGWS